MVFKMTLSYERPCLTTNPLAGTRILGSTLSFSIFLFFRLRFQVAGPQLLEGVWVFGLNFFSRTEQPLQIT